MPCDQVREIVGDVGRRTDKPKAVHDLAVLLVGRDLARASELVSVTVERLTARLYSRRQAGKLLRCWRDTPGS
jgi:hypothetical protein